MQHDTPPVLWRISDGRAGHDNQSLGLLDALQERHPLNSLSVPAVSRAGLVKGLIVRAWPDDPPDDDAARPHVIIAAGHATHGSVLLAGHLYGAKTVVLMRPGVPTGWFDYCLIPQHDEVLPSARILLTCGAVNRIRPARNQDRSQGLILLGGASKHYHDGDAVLFTAIDTVAERCADIHWRISDSPRSSPHLRQHLQALRQENLHFTCWQDCPPGWLARQLDRAYSVWVGEDSISMIYDALSAGARVGLLPMPRKRYSRLHRAVDELAAEGRVCRYQDWQADGKLPPPGPPVQEASRCAAELIGRGLFDRSSAP